MNIAYKKPSSLRSSQSKIFAFLVVIGMSCNAHAAGKQSASVTTDAAAQQAAAQQAAAQQAAAQQAAAQQAAAQQAAAQQAAAQQAAAQQAAAQQAAAQQAAAQQAAAQQAAAQQAAAQQAAAQQAAAQQAAAQQAAAQQAAAQQAAAQQAAAQQAAAQQAAAQQAAAQQAAAQQAAARAQAAAQQAARANSLNSSNRAHLSQAVAVSSLTVPLTRFTGGSYDWLNSDFGDPQYLFAKLGGGFSSDSADRVSVTFGRNQLISFSVPQDVINSLIDAKLLLNVGGDSVIMAKGYENQIYSAVINNTGRVYASSSSVHAGQVEFLASSVTVSQARSGSDPYTDPASKNPGNSELNSGGRGGSPFIDRTTGANTGGGAHLVPGTGRGAGGPGDGYGPGNGADQGCPRGDCFVTIVPPPPPPTNEAGQPQIQVDQPQTIPTNTILLASLSPIALPMPIPEFTPPTALGVVEIKSSSIEITINTPPLYPASAKEQGIEGEALVRVVVDPATGQISRIELARTSGSVDLDNAALESAKSWSYSPPSVSVSNQYPIQFEVPVSFKINRS